MPINRAEIRAIPLFSTLGEQELEHIATLTIERRYKRGELILLEGDPGGALQYVHAGLVKVFKTSLDGREQVLSLITAGNTFNDVPALDGGPNPASAAALESAVIYSLRHVDLQMLIRTHPAVAEAVVHRMASALRHLVSLVEDLSLRRVTGRIAKILLEQDDTLHTNPDGHRLTQQEIAALAGTAREVVGRTLKDLEGAGAIRTRQGRITILNHQMLQIFSTGHPDPP